MEHVTFVNVSPIQFFDSTQYNDIDNKDTIYDQQIENIDAIEQVKIPQEENVITVEVVHDYEDKSSSMVEIIDDNEINMECFDDRDEDILIDPSSPIKVKSKVLDISPNIPLIPTGVNGGVIAKIPVILAQLVIPINLTSFVDLPQEAIKIKDINKRLNLIECILLQPTNVLFIKGFINKSIEYSTTGFFNLKGVSGKVGNYTIDIPFESSTAVSFFTQPLDPIANTKEVFQYLENDLSIFNQISEEFFNEIPFCKLLSSKIIEFDELINLKDSEKDFIQIQEKMAIEIRLEVLQNQPVAILSANNKINKT